MTESDSRLNTSWEYHPLNGFYDEMVADTGTIRPHWQPLVEALNQIGPGGLAERWQEGRRLIHDNGVTYNVYGDPQSTERPWPLDPLPLLLERTEWATIEAAIAQRAMLLNRVLQDLYGPQRLLKDGHLPAELVFGHPGFLRPCSGVTPPDNIWLHSYSADIARSPNGNWWVLADRTQAPSGSGYALENRLVSLRVLPDVFRAGNVQRLAPFFQAYKNTLRSLAPKRENPRIVLLTPGPFNETWFEHAFLARYLGFTLVEGGDLTVRDNFVYLKTLGGLLPVDVIVRRQDDTFCDPLELRGDSMLGIPGLVQAVWSGHVAVANALGSGLAESSGLAAFLPALSRHVLGEDLRMPNIATWWCGEKNACLQVEQRLARLVLKPATPALDFEPIFGARLGPRQRALMMEKIRANPGAYVAQEQVSLSTAPVARGGLLDPRHLVLRVFAVASGGSYAVMPGGLTRLGSSLDSLVVSMQHGGGSKDSWVLAESPAPDFTLLRRAAGPLPVSRATFDLPSRVADNLYWLGRYLERFENAVRTVRVILPRLY
ncbi:MAG: circularly permuted type 2 ATP-grasp protein, partial [Acidobacteriota bacterium]